MNNLPISVIITTYNDSEYLKEAIESVFGQSQLPQQLIIVDDGSTKDDAKKIAESFFDNKENISVIFFKKKNGGASSARNYGLRYVSQKYIAFLDADDRMLKNNLEQKYNCFKNLGDDYFGVYGSAITSEGVSYNFCNIDGYTSTSLVGFYNYGIPGGCPYYLFRTKSIVSISGFDESLSNNEDFDLIIRMIMKGQACKGVVGCSLFINIRSDSLSRDKNHYNVFCDIMKFLEKAEKENFFTKEELNKRKSIAYLFLAKKIIRKNPLKSIKLINKAVLYTKNPYRLYQIYKQR